MVFWKSAHTSLAVVSIHLSLAELNTGKSRAKAFWFITPNVEVFLTLTNKPPNSGLSYFTYRDFYCRLTQLHAKSYRAEPCLGWSALASGCTPPHPVTLQHPGVYPNVPWVILSEPQFTEKDLERMSLLPEVCELCVKAQKDLQHFHHLACSLTAKRTCHENITKLAREEASHVGRK